MINIDLNTYNMLPQLPDCFTVDGLTESANVSVIIDDESVYSTNLALYEGQVKFYGLRDIIARTMENKALATPVCRFKVTATSGSDTMQTSEVYVIYAAYTPANISAERFVQMRFLSSRTYIELPAEAPCSISMMVTTAGLSPVVWALFRKNDVIQAVKVSLEPVTEQTPCIVQLDVAPATVKALADEQYGTDCGTIVAYNVYAGERKMALFVRNEEPEIIFTFRNAFNTDEQAYIYGSSKLITTVDRKEAVCMNRKSYYDEGVTRKREVTTEALSIETSAWLNELFTSKHVTTDVGGGKEAVVLISDITSEISDGPDAVNRHKFSWEFDDKQQWLDISDHERVFTDEYIRVFK